ncbi:MAG: 4Fe-4S dicluster domain-containing protein [Phycisphaerales bacterium]|nr:4Fe-4S dicluster domain-containing protein [Phycisphaerales bacterium]
MSSIKDRYWRSVEDLTQSEDFREWMHREFQDGATELSTEDRRQFLKVMGASFALAGLSIAGCRRWPETHVVPAANQPANRTPGQPVYYASAWEFAGFAQPMLVKSFDGRPIKLEPNPSHPFGGAGLSSVAQAQVLAMYDPDRSRTVLSRGTRSTYPQFSSFFATKAAALRAQRGTGLAILADYRSGPTYAATMAAVHTAFPGAMVVAWEPLSRDNASDGTALAFSSPRRVLNRFDRAKVIISLGDDFLYSTPLASQWAFQWSKGRAIEAADPKVQEITRLYVVESGLTLTGMNADERLAVRPSGVVLVAALVAHAIGAGQGDAALTGAIDAIASSPAAQSQLAGKGKAIIDAIVADLKTHRSAALLTAGDTASPLTHALVAACNRTLGADGTTLAYLDEPIAPSAANFGALVAAMGAGSIDTLIILGGNPVYDAPADLDFGTALAKVPHVVHLDMYANETALHPACSWHIPEASFLEAWGDARSFDGTVTIQQPLILPMVAGDQGGKCQIELLSELVGASALDSQTIVRKTHEASSGLTGQAFDAAWRSWLDEGFVPSSAYAVAESPFNAAALASALRAYAAPTSHAPELSFLRDMKVWDGRFSNLGWLQELPDPVTKINWDNAALMDQTLAQTLGVRRGDMVKLSLTTGNSTRSIEAVAWPLPGHSAGTVSLALGYGRSGAGVGAVAEAAGFNAFKLRTTNTLDWAPTLSIERTGEKYAVAHTQDHGAADALVTSVPEQGIQDRLPTLIREAPLAVYRNHPDFARHVTHVTSRLSLWEESNLDGAQFRWAMSVDLAKCTGCSACVTACQAENNIPIVGKDQVLRGREMHWIRIDRYFKGSSPASPDSFAIQPVTCMHCENAPCEQVCPVAATVHDADGLNVMVYNRCVGTRYCSNNCPYKVRRFNFFDYQRREPQREEGLAKVKPEYYVDEGPDIWLRMQFNPDVTVRMRGVMEKCTFCTQRIQSAKIKSKNAWAMAGGERPGAANFSIPDGEIQTACQQACPTNAIVFGDLNVKDSRVAKLHRSGRSYQLLEELNTKTRVQYLARVTNPATTQPPGHAEPSTAPDHPHAGL